MKNTLSAATIAVSILLTGCVAPPAQNPIFHYSKTGGTLEEEKKDYAECRLEAAKATAGANSAVTYDISEAVVHDAVIAQRQKQILGMCLEARGYHPVYQY